ncbi:uncharacterized protein WM277_015978 isoform 1-T1 [Molossus nigricans]
MKSCKVDFTLPNFQIRKLSSVYQVQGGVVGPVHGPAWPGGHRGPHARSRTCLGPGTSSPPCGSPESEQPARFLFIWFVFFFSVQGILTWLKFHHSDQNLIFSSFNKFHVQSAATSIPHDLQEKLLLFATVAPDPGLRETDEEIWQELEEPWSGCCLRITSQASRK